MSDAVEIASIVSLLANPANSLLKTQHTTPKIYIYSQHQFVPANLRVIIGHMMIDLNAVQMMHSWRMKIQLNWGEN